MCRVNVRWRQELVRISRCGRSGARAEQKGRSKIKSEWSRPSRRVLQHILNNSGHGSHQHWPPRLVGCAVYVNATAGAFSRGTAELLVLDLGTWTGICIYLAVSDRTPRAFLFQMAGFSAAVISVPYLDDPGNIFMATISRVEEMKVAILAVTLAFGFSPTRF
ncbi:FUSC family protein [Hyphomicrobium sp. B1]|uniref:FUSC family protein n=1 Tax=unclassified Hyphomicrobium TaxID=2619925 RepID=UPI0039C31205